MRDKLGKGENIGSWTGPEAAWLWFVRVFVQEALMAACWERQKPRLPLREHAVSEKWLLLQDPSGVSP